MKRFLSVAVLCLLTLRLLPVLSALDEIPEPEKRTIPELSLTERVVDLLEAVEDESPEVFRRMNELPREEALARIMRALDSGVVPASSTTGKSPIVEFSSDDFRQYPVFGLTDRKFPYLRFDLVVPDRMTQAIQELKKVSDGTVPTGVIVDLREAGTGVYLSMNALPEALGKLGCPVMVLISGKTKGAGELLAAVLRRDCGAVLVGTETAGNIFPLERIVVNDVKWFVPDPPAEYYDISPYALKPDLEKDSEVRLSFDELKEKPDKLDGDPLLRLAADLLTMKAAVKPVAE
ncbi:MAG: S41 family peptidase [Lentisphaeria bacterium]|nr:S41 family peptidase [Lentisphaeria bacterium]